MGQGYYNQYGIYPTPNIDWSKVFSNSSGDAKSDTKKMSAKEIGEQYYAEVTEREKYKKVQKQLFDEFKLDEQIKTNYERQKELKENRSADGSSSVSTGGKNSVTRWLSNAGTALKNIGKSIIGYDKDGKWNPTKCIKNIAITAAAIGATFIPVVGPVIGYGLLTAGAIGGSIGIAKGISKLNNAKTNKEIDEAQQAICSNAFVVGTSVFGLRGIGKAFRTSATTAANASSAASRTSLLGKVVESCSNFGRDITVNAFSATGHAIKSDLALIAVKGGGFTGFMKASGSKISEPLKSIFKGWDKKYNEQFLEYKNSVETQISELNSKIAAETDLAKRALLEEEKIFLETNLADINKIGTTVKTQADFNKLATDNMSSFNKEYVSTMYSKNPAGKYEINGQIIEPKAFEAFKNRVIRIQEANNIAIERLVVNKANAMRSLAKEPDNYKALLDEYVDIANIEKSVIKPSHWGKNEYQIAIGGKNPSLIGRFLNTITKSTVSPTTRPLFGYNTWVDPVYSNPLFTSTQYTADEVEKELEFLEKQAKIFAKLKDAKSNKEFQEALEEYKKFEAEHTQKETTTATNDNKTVATA